MWALAVYCFKASGGTCHCLGSSLLFGGLVVVAYLASITSSNYMAMAISNALYFIFIDLTLVSLVGYLAGFLGLRGAKGIDSLKVALLVITAVDAIIELSNPWTGLAMGYVESEQHTLAHWSYAPLPLYEAHLVFCLLLIAGCIVLPAWKMAKSPRAYRMRYLPFIIAIAVIAICNAFFIIFRIARIDFSVILYGIAGIIMFFCHFYYMQHGFLNRVQDLLMDNIHHPVVFFDFEDNYCYGNKDLKETFKDAGLDDSCTLGTFLERTGLSRPVPEERYRESRSFTWINRKAGSEARSYRCDYKILEDSKGRFIGTLVVFIDNSLAIDVITGFSSKVSFQKEIFEAEEEHELPYSVVAFDLNRLNILNSVVSREAGDQAIRMLGDAMRETFPPAAGYARLDDAVLLAHCPRMSSAEADRLAIKVGERISMADLGTGPLEMQHAVSSITDRNQTIMSAVSMAVRSLRVKKMLDTDSSHSSLLDSLAQTLLESDSTTEAHVERTRILGERLGKRLGLSDYDQSSLSLLCLLHDIGKLGIPLEILNKPGKLNDAEWELMRSHAEKGYRIAMASEELRDIAPCILHHHECWDGNGYPDGLAKDAIPLLSRIIAVVDTYDAMVNDRPYRKGTSNAAACAELKRCAGRQFDPHIVSVFLDMLQDAGDLEEEKPAVAEASDWLVKPRGLEELEEASNEPTPLKRVDSVMYSRYILGAENRIIEVDDNFEALTGYTPEDVEEYKLTQFDLISPVDMDSYIQEIMAQSANAQLSYIEHRLRRKDGAESHVMCMGRVFFDSVTHEAKTEIVVADIAQTNAMGIFLGDAKESARRSVEYWEHGAKVDSLTGILNHRAFETDFDQISASTQGKVVFGIIDVDYFKDYNDRFGHPAGDGLLCTLAQLMEGALPVRSICGRLGGDEFAFAFSVSSDIDDTVLEKEVGSVWKASSMALAKLGNGITTSMGIAVSSASGNNFDTFYRNADLALYEVKERGRNGMQLLRF